MSKTEAYRWIGAVIGGVVGLLIAVVSEGFGGVDMTPKSRVVS
jgi:uncharacterized membrane protein